MPYRTNFLCSVMTGMNMFMGFEMQILALLPCRQAMHRNLNVTRESKVELQSGN